MFKHLHRWRKAWPYLLFLALILFSLRDVLTLPGVLGHSWDWDISASPEQIWGRLTHDFFVWDYELRGGYYSPFRTGGLLSLFALPFSLLGGVIYSRLFIIVPMFLAAICMRRFAYEVLKLDAWWSTTAGILYMLSPVVFSRVLAGHNLLVPYALFPLLYIYLQRTVEGCNADRFPLRDAIIAGLLLGIQAIHASMMVLAFIVVGLVFVFALIHSSRRLRTVLAGVVIFVIFGLLNTYWALPVGIGYTTSGTLFHSGSAIDSPNQATASSVVTQRQNLFRETMQPLAQSLRMDSFASYATEFIYPVPGILGTPWLVVSYLLPILAFAVLLGQRRQQEATIILVIAGLVGATVASGTTVPVGGLIAEWLMLHVFPVWAEFGNAVRALPLVAFALCALVPASLQRLASRPRLSPSVAVGSALAIGIYVSPFLAGSTMVDARYAQALKSFQPSSQDQQVYQLLKKQEEDFRISYVPPPWMYYPELYDLGYEWMGGLSPHPEFYLPYINPDAWLAPTQLQADGQASLSGRLLGLAAVKYLIYPRARFVNPSQGLFPSSNSATLANSSRARLIDQVLESQKNLPPESTAFTSTLLLRNESYLPRIYSASQATLVQGSSDQLPAVASSSLFTGAPALFFNQQQEPAAARRLTALADQLVQTERSTPGNWATSADARLYYLLPFSPLGDSNQTFSAAQPGSYSFKVGTFPFQFVPAGPNDVSNATFNPIDPGALASVSSNLLYNFSLRPDGNSQVTAYFPAERSSDQYIEMNEPVEPISLYDFPNLFINSQVDNTGNQAVAVQLHLDFEGDEGEDATWTSPPFSHAKFRADDLNVLQAVRAEFPEKEHYRVVGVGLRFLRNSQPEWDRTVYPAGLYNFWIQELKLYGSPSKPGWVWEPPSNLVTSNPTTLSRSIESLDLSRFPLELEYEAEGPATLYVQAQLVTHNQKGEQKVLPVQGQLITPFSDGKLTLDARDMLVAASAEERLSASRLEVVVHPLRGSAEFRPTTLRLLRVGSRWLPTEQDSHAPAPPILMLDGKPIALRASPSQADEVIYSSGDFNLSKGEHSVSVGYSTPDSTFAVDSVQIVPWPEKTERIKPPTLTFGSVNPTRWRIHVSDAQAPYFVVFSESFDLGWSAFIIPRTQSQADNANSHSWYEQSALLSWLFGSANANEIQDHFLVNGFANSWYVEQTGDYDIVVEFVPQRMFEAGWIVSLTTLAGSAVIILLRRRR